MDTKELLQRSHMEIVGLRRANELLSAKIEVFELCSSMVQAEPPRRGYRAMHPDIAHELQQRLDEIEKSEDAQLVDAKTRAD